MVIVITFAIYSEAEADLRMTAGSMKAAADSAALTFANDASLAVVSSSDVDSLGKAEVWSYVYFSINSSREYDFHSQNNMITFDSARAMRIGVGVLNIKWIDSDSALTVGKYAGGADFLKKFSDCTIMASLSDPVSPPNLCCWRIEFKYNDSAMTVLINALTGEVIWSDTSNNGVLNYYSLQTGNYWEYKTDSFDCDNAPPCQEDTSAYSIEAMGDTILPNGLHYEIMVCRSLPGNLKFYFYERIDSSTSSVFRYDTTSRNHEHKVDSLFAIPGDSFLSGERAPSPYAYSPLYNTFCYSAESKGLLGITTTVKLFVHEESLYEENYTLAKGFGVYEINDGWDFGSSTTTLVYAKINGVEYGTKISVGIVGRPPTPTTFALFQNYPNPFNPSTIITYQLPMVGHVTLKVYDVLGRVVMTLLDEIKQPGNYQAAFDGSRLASGVYFYRINFRTNDGKNFISTKKALLVK